MILNPKLKQRGRSFPPALYCVEMIRNASNDFTSTVFRVINISVDKT